MSTLYQTTVTALENQAFALMGRMHVILRRQNGRVTDIEYMRVDPGYCRHLLEMAIQLPNQDLQQICIKLQDIYFGQEGLFVRPPPKLPLLARFAATATATSSLPRISVQPEEISLSGAATLPVPDASTAVDRSYIGRLR